MDLRPELETIFPNLRKDGYCISSDSDPHYNCIAFAAGRTDVRWWPSTVPADDPYWPPVVLREETLDAFVAAYGTLGYAPCDGPELEGGFEKIALYADLNGIPTHAAKQLPSGAWTSKLGKFVDIEHNTLAALESGAYGIAMKFLKRPCEV